MRNVFINEAFTKAINEYLDNKDNENGITYNSFLVVFIRLLIIIYGEEFIVNPIMVGSVEALRGNLTKYGYAEDNVNKLFVDLQLYYEMEQTNNNLNNKKDNPYFITIQKQLIDMFIMKRLNNSVTPKEERTFKNLLYTPHSNIPLIVSYNYLTASDVSEIENYFIKKMKENVKVAKIHNRVVLNVKAYEIMGNSLEQINAMSNEELEKLNHKVYDFFKIRENAINKEYLLEKAIESYKKERDKLTSGNGYVDILLIMSILSTLVMIGAILKFLVF